jgi:hypothetical protein
MIGVGYAIHLMRFDRLGAPGLLLLVLVGAILVRAIIALACAGSWVPRSQDDADEQQ